MEGWIGKDDSLADVLFFDHGWLEKGEALVSSVKLSGCPDKIEITIRRVLK